jgi:hypothetical protein
LSALLKRFWAEHRLASVISAALLLLGLLIKPWTLVLVLLVALGGPLLRHLDGFSSGRMANWRRSDWIALALGVAVVLLALTGNTSGRVALVMALLPVAWVLATDRTVLQPTTAAKPTTAERAPKTLSAVASPAKRLVGKELLDKINAMGDAGKSELVKACGYTSKTPEGGERINFTAFYEALLEAKGVGNSEKDSEPTPKSRTEEAGEPPIAQSISTEVITYLDQVIDDNIDDFDRDGSYKVRPDYGYSKFYLDSVEGSYDMSLQGLIHYIMNDEDIYDKFLSEAQLDGVRDCIENHPEAIYSVDTSEGNGEEVEALLDEVYYRCICHVARRLKKAGLNVDAFGDFLDDDEDEDSDESTSDNLASTRASSAITSAAQAATNQTERRTPGVLHIRPLGIQRSSGPLSVSVIKSSISEPDDDGDISVDLSMSLASGSEEDIELVISKFIVLNCSGLPLLEREDEHELLITNGESEEIDLYSGYFKSNLLGGASPSDTQALVQFIPCGCQFIELPAIDIPSTGILVGIESAVQILPELNLHGLSIYAPQPDDDGECNLEFKGLIANDSNISLSKLVITIKVTDRNGREVEETEWSDKVPPFSTACFDSSIWGIKSSRLEGSKAVVSIKAFHSLGHHEISWSVGSPPTQVQPEGSSASGGVVPTQPKAASPAQRGDRASELAASTIKEETSPSFDVSITTATYQPPDDDGDTRFEAQYCLTNQSNQPIELLLSRLFVLHRSGLLVATTEDETEDMADSGESIHASISTWGTSARDLDANPSTSQLLLQITACSCIYQDLGSIHCPDQGGLATMRPEPQASNGLTIAAISVTTDPPDDGECRINIKALIRNNSNLSIPKIVLETKLMTASGRELEDTNSQEELEANGEILIEDSFWGIKENRLNSSRLHFSLKAFASLGTSKTIAGTITEEDQ